MEQIEFDSYGNVVTEGVPLGTVLLIVIKGEVHVTQLERAERDEDAQSPWMAQARNDAELQAQAHALVERENPDCLLRRGVHTVLRCPADLAAQAIFENTR